MALLRRAKSVHAAWDALSPDARVAWRGLLVSHRLIMGQLDADLEAATGWGLSTFDVLLTLSDAPDERAQMSALADACRMSRSGITRLADRLEAAELIVRARGETDPRQVFAQLTEPGWRQLGLMVEVHVAGIRERFVDHLTATQLGQVAAVWWRLGRGDPRLTRDLVRAAQPRTARRRRPRND